MKAIMFLLGFLTFIGLVQNPAQAQSEDILSAGYYRGPGRSAVDVYVRENRGPFLNVRVFVDPVGGTKGDKSGFQGLEVSMSLEQYRELFESEYSTEDMKLPQSNTDLQISAKAVQTNRSTRNVTLYQGWYQVKRGQRDIRSEQVVEMELVDQTIHSVRVVSRTPNWRGKLITKFDGQVGVSRYLEDFGVGFYGISRDVSYGRAFSGSAVSRGVLDPSASNLQRICQNDCDPVGNGNRCSRVF